MPDCTAFLDFDHTLFDTDEFFHVDLRASFRHLGVDSASWERAYARAWPSGYSLDGHAGEMSREPGNQQLLDDMRRILRESFADLRRYLFPDVLPFLEDAKAKGVRLYLLSFGNAEWQRYKVRACRIEEYFDNVFFTAREGEKVKLILGHAGSGGRVLAVDNNPSELDLIREAAPEVVTYCINRVPRELVGSADEMSRLRFLEAREYAKRPWRHGHVRCRTLDEVVTS